MESKIDYKQIKEDLTIMWLHNQEYIKKEDKKNWFEIIMKLENDIEQIQNIKEKIGKEDYITNNKVLKYVYQEGKHIIEYKDKKMLYTTDDITKILEIAIRINEEILPLGSVVKLKNMPGLFVVTNRFVITKEDEYYCQYEGVLYPIGTVKREKIYLFNNIGIDEVVYKGYENDEERAYITLMKKVFVIEKNMMLTEK